MTLPFVPDCGDLAPHEPTVSHLPRAKSDCCLRCQCDRCLGYACEPDELAIAAARFPTGRPGKVPGAARAYLRSFNQPSLLALPGRGLELLTEAELDAIERRAS